MNFLFNIFDVLIYGFFIGVWVSAFIKFILKNGDKPK